MIVPSPVSFLEMENQMRQHHQGVEVEQIQAEHLRLSWVRIPDIKQVTERLTLESQPCLHLYLPLNGQVGLVTGVEGQVHCSNDQIAGLCMFLFHEYLEARDTCSL